MQDPIPPKSWTPTRATLGGSIFGTAVAQLIVGICNRLLHTPLGPELGGAITTICIFAATYFIPERQT